jgi:hypothetical protein
MVVVVVVLLQVTSGDNLFIGFFSLIISIICIVMDIAVTTLLLTKVVSHNKDH